MLENIKVLYHSSIRISNNKVIYMDKNTNEIEYTMTWRKSKINYKLFHKL